MELRPWWKQICPEQEMEELDLIILEIHAIWILDYKYILYSMFATLILIRYALISCFFIVFVTYSRINSIISYWWIQEYGIYTLSLCLIDGS